MTARLHATMQPPATLPVGVPAPFLPGGLRGRMPAHVPPDIARVVAEYQGARGHVFDWGHVLVTHWPPLTTWRVVPVALWEQVAIAMPRDPVPVPALLPLLAPLVREHIVPQLPCGVHVAGMQRAGRRCPHALFCLVHDDPATRQRADAWVHGHLAQRLLPAMLEHAPAIVVAHLRCNTPTEP